MTLKQELLAEAVESYLECYGEEETLYESRVNDMALAFGVTGKQLMTKLNKLRAEQEAEHYEERRTYAVEYQDERDNYLPPGGMDIWRNEDGEYCCG